MSNRSFTKMHFVPYFLNLYIILLLLLFLYVPTLIFQTEAQTLTTEEASRKSVSAIFIFGDSTSDPGNNDFIITPFKSNFPPYGRDFVNQIPTGRFTNGRLANDYIAKYLGIKDYVPPYLDPSLSKEELMTGVSFASAGSGFDPLTPRIGNVISLKTQLKYFKAYQSRLAAEIGKEKTEDVIRNSLFLVSAGTNDFVVNYFTIPVRRKNYTIPAYIDFCLQHVQLFMQGGQYPPDIESHSIERLAPDMRSYMDPSCKAQIIESVPTDKLSWLYYHPNLHRQGLVDVGARRIGVAGLPPMGCLPVVITLFSKNAITDRGCINNISYIAQTYNQKLQLQLNSIQARLADLGPRIAYLDIYGPLVDMTAQAHKYDFDEVTSGCCGTGYLEASYLCNPKSYVCPDASKYVFWDSIHPTEKSYYIVSQALQPTIDSIIHD